MAQNAKNNTVISIDTTDKSIHLYYADGGDKNAVRHEVRPYQTRDFDEEFFKMFQETLEDLAQKYPGATSGGTTVVMPDTAVMVDTIQLPTTRKVAQNLSLTNSLNTYFKNRGELNLLVNRATATKQYFTTLVHGMRNDLIASTKTACAAAHFNVNSIVFASLATANAAHVFNPKCRASNFMLLDIRSESSRIVFCFKGITVGFETLPFGYSILDSGKVAAEDMLFDHSVAELAVLNAREKAKAKQLTMMGEDNPDIARAEAGEEAEEQTFSAPVAARTAQAVKSLPKKTPRKLPKYMLRPVPEAEEEIAYENFRIFEKWALTFIMNNRNLIALGAPEMIYVNMPERFSYLYEKVNAEEKENGIAFQPLGAEKEKEEIRENLELYGGLFSKTYNTETDFA